MKCKMTERSKQIFGNDIAPGAYKKAVRSKQKFIRKFGDDSTKNYPTSIKANPYIGPELGVSDIRVGEEGTFIRRKESSSEISVWDLVITASPWRSHPQHMRWGMNRTGWI